MDFFKLIKSLDELVYEVLSWLLFYPITLWRVVRRPVATMLQAERELRDDAERQYDDAIGPPLFLFLTLALLHGLELWLGNSRDSDELIKSTTGLSRLITNDTNLVIFRILMFGLLPLTVARRLLTLRGARLDKNQLRAPFFGQCYAVAVYAILFNVPTLTARMEAKAQAIASLASLAVAALWLIVVEARWFAAKLEVRAWGGGLKNALVIYAEWVLLLIVVVALLR